MNDESKENHSTKTLASSIKFFNSGNPMALSAGFSGDTFPFTASALEEFIPIAASFCIFRLTSFLLLFSSSAAISSSSPISIKKNSQYTINLQKSAKFIRANMIFRIREKKSLHKYQVMSIPMF